MADGDSELGRAVSSAGGERRLVAQDVVAGYGNHEVLHGVSVRSHEGITCVLGPNGSGKSTLLKTLAGNLQPWSGSIRFGDVDITGASSHDVVREGIVYVPQDGGLFPSMTVRENLRLGAHTVDDADVVADRLDVVLEVFPALESKLSQRARSLSGGQQMMLAFARAMMTGADLYELDEPLAGLAPSIVDDILEHVVTLAEQDVQVILVEQQVRSALEIADHVYLLAQGEIKFDGSADDLSDEDELMDLYLGID